MIAQPKINWGISTLGCHELDLPAICGLAARHNVQNLEIRSVADCLDLPTYLDANYTGSSDACQRVLDADQQNIVALNSGFSLIGADDHAREELLAFTRWANRLGVPYIRVFGGGSMAEPLTEADLKAACDNLRWWETLRAANNWTTRLALETHDGFSSGERCLQLQRELDQPLHIIWDTHHTWKMGNESPQQTWDQIACMIRHVHIKDSVSIPSARHPYSYVLPGEGEFPANEVFETLRENNYAGVVSLEWERKWHPYLPDLDTALTVLESSGWKAGQPV